MIDNIIKILYENDLESILSEFTLFYEEKPVLTGIATIKTNNDKIVIKGSNYNFLEIKPKSKENIIKIDINDFPKYYSCRLTNFQKPYRKSEFINKDIEVRLYKVLLDSNFSFTMSESNNNEFNCSIIPLYYKDIDGTKFAEIYTINK